jgi:glycosyltransferase involved in cell wall biosynthesis
MEFNWLGYLCSGTKNLIVQYFFSFTKFLEFRMSKIAKPIRVCYVTSAFPPFSCGVGDHVARVSAALIQTNVEVTVITSTNNQGPVKPGGAVVEAIINKWDWNGWKRVYREVAAGSFDVIHFEYPTRYSVPRSQILRYLPLTLPFAILSCLHLKRIPRVLTVHEYYQSGLFARIKVLMDSLLSTKVIVVTPVDEKKLIQNFSLRKKIHFMPVGANIPIHGHDLVQIENIKRAHGVGVQEKLICFFGFLALSRGFEDLISAVEILIDGGVRVRVFVIGLVSNKRYLSTLKKIVASKGLNDAFIWIGFIEDDRVADYIQACDVTVQPYLHGATTNRSSLISAVALGVPTVTTYVEGITPEYFRHESNMLLVRPRSPEDLAIEVLRLLTDGNLREQLFKGMQVLAKRFSWSSAAAVSAEIYHGLR